MVCLEEAHTSGQATQMATGRPAFRTKSLLLALSLSTFGPLTRLAGREIILSTRYLPFKRNSAKPERRQKSARSLSRVPASACELACCRPAGISVPFLLLLSLPLLLLLLSMLF